MLIDLQLHSIYSDGYLTPTELVKFISGQGIRVAALTDHNTVSGLDEFRNACRANRIKPITGLELYIKLHNRRFNLLWYNFNDNDPELHNVLRNSQKRRRRQMRLALERLTEKRGLRLNINNILDKYNHYIPLNHVVDDIMAVSANAGKIKRKLGINHPREGQIMAEYFHNKNFGVLHNSFIDIDRVLELRRRIGGQLILCHPAKHGGITRDFFEDIRKLGINGVEKLTPHHSYGKIVYIQHLARELDLIETGGSDFHRFEGGNHLIQNSWQYYRVDSKHLRKIKKIIG